MRPCTAISIVLMATATVSAAPIHVKRDPSFLDSWNDGVDKLNRWSDNLWSRDLGKATADPDTSIHIKRDPSFLDSWNDSVDKLNRWSDNFWSRDLNGATADAH